MTAPSAGAAVIRAGYPPSRQSRLPESNGDPRVTTAERGGVLRDQSAIGIATVAVMDPDFILDLARPVATGVAGDRDHAAEGRFR